MRALPGPDGGGNFMADVCLSPCTSYAPDAVRAAVEAATAPLGGIAAHVQRGDHVLLKPNFLMAARPEQAVCTHPAVVRAVAELVLDCGGRPFVADSPAWGSARGVAKANGIADVCRDLDIPLYELKSARRVHTPFAQVFTHLTVDARAMDADVIINLPKMKTHAQLYFTCATKNMFGCVTGKRKAWWHAKAGTYANYFGLMLVETLRLLAPALTVADAVVAMEGQGPGKGDPRNVGLIAAGVDCVAIDRVLCEVIGFDPARVCYLEAAEELGLFTPRLEDITLHGAPLAECRIADFKEPPSISPIGFSLPRVAKSTIKQAWLTGVKGA